MTDPLVSIILPVYNRASLVGRAIESVLVQSYSHWELIVVDDGSTDNTRQVIEQYGARLTLLSQRNTGAYAARNLALQHVCGDFIAFIDSDDVWYPNRLELQMPLFAKPEIGVVFGNAALMDYASGPPRPLGYTFFDLFPPQRGNILRALAHENFIPQSAVIARRECFQKFGGFSLTSPISADYAKWAQLATHYQFDYVPACLFEYAFHAGNLSRGALRAYFAPTKLFDELIAHAAGTQAENDLRRLAVYFEWNLALALIYRARAHFAQAITHAPSLELRFRWFGEFLQHKLYRAVHRLRRR